MQAFSLLYLDFTKLRVKSEFDSTGVPNPNSCPIENGYVPNSNACYKILSDVLMSYDQAYENCLADNDGTKAFAGLATIWDVHENALLQSLILEREEVKLQNYWIG